MQGVTTEKSATVFQVHKCCDTTGLSFEAVTCVKICNWDSIQLFGLRLKHFWKNKLNQTDVVQY